MGTALTRLLRRTRNYIHTVSWCLVLFARQDWKLATLAFVLGLAAPAFQGFSVLLLSLFSALFLGEQSFSVPIIGPFFLALAPMGRVALLLAALLASSLSYYLGRWLYIQIGAGAFARWLEDMVAARQSLPDPRKPDASKLLLLQSGDLMRGLRQTSMAAIQLAEVMPKLLAALLASATLVYMQPLLMLLAFVLFGLAAIFMVPSMLSAVKAMQKLQQATSDYRSILVGKGGKEAPPQQRAEAARSAFAQRFLIGPVITLVLGIGSAIAVCAAVLFLVTSSAVDQQANLAPLVAFLGTLQIALAGYSRGLAALANLSRFYEMIQYFKRFRLDYEREPKAALGRVTAATEIQLPCKMQPEGLRYIASTPLALVGARSLEEGQVAMLAAYDADTKRPLATSLLTEQLTGKKADHSGLRVIWARDLLDVKNQSDGKQTSPSKDPLGPDIIAEPGLVILYRNSDQVGQFSEKTLGLVHAGRLAGLASHHDPKWQRLLNMAKRRRALASDGTGANDDEE